MRPVGCWRKYREYGQSRARTVCALRLLQIAPAVIWSRRRRAALALTGALAGHAALVMAGDLSALRAISVVARSGWLRHRSLCGWRGRGAGDAPALGAVSADCLGDGRPAIQTILKVHLRRPMVAEAIEAIGRITPARRRAAAGHRRQ